MPYKDINKRRAAHKRYYSKNLDLYRRKNARRKLMLLTYVNELKTKPCADCNVSYPAYVMDFDHRIGNEKLSSIARMIRDGRGKEKIIAEMSKCELVCANCHRERTYQRLRNKV